MYSVLNTHTRMLNSLLFFRATILPRRWPISTTKFNRPEVVFNDRNDEINGWHHAPRTGPRESMNAVGVRGCKMISGTL